MPGTVADLQAYAASLGPPGGTSQGPPRGNALLALIGQIALQAGLGTEGARAAQAVAQTEGALYGAVGDVRGGGSYGPLQFYAQGMLPVFASALGVSADQAKQIVTQHPETAVQWALRGYLGQAIRDGLSQGLSGPRLAVYAQRYGQRSQASERAGQSYQALFAGNPGVYGGDSRAASARPAAGAQPTVAPAAGAQPTAATAAPAGQPGDVLYKGGLAPNQFGDAQLTKDEALAACGPAAAVAFARRYGRNPTLREALDLAKTTGWTPEGGMNGLGNEMRLLERMGVPHRLEAGDPNWDAVVHDALQGNPVILSTPKHYWVIDGYDPEHGLFHVGNTGLARRDVNKQWVKASEIAAADGRVQGALYTDDPTVPGTSYAARGTGRLVGDDWRLTASPVPEARGGALPPVGGPAFGEPGQVDPNAGARTTPAADASSSYEYKDWNPFDSEGWRAVGRIHRSFLELPERGRRFLEQENERLDAERARRFGQIPTFLGATNTPSVFDEMLSPLRGVPFLSPPVAGG